MRLYVIGPVSGHEGTTARSSRRPAGSLRRPASRSPSPTTRSSRERRGRAPCAPQYGRCCPRTVASLATTAWRSCPACSARRERDASAACARSWAYRSRPWRSGAGDEVHQPVLRHRGGERRMGSSRMGTHGVRGDRAVLLRAIGEEIPRSPQPWRRERGGLEFISWKMRPHHRREPVSGVQRRGQPQGIG